MPDRVQNLDLFGGSDRIGPPHSESAAAAEERSPGAHDAVSEALPVEPDGAPEPAASRTRSARSQDWSVAKVNATARRILEGGLPPLWVVGEVTNFTRARSGHCYFTLRDETAQLRCVMWRDDARRLPTAPEEGMEVRAFGRITVYEARGDFQLSVSRLEGKADGLWKLALDRLRAKLEAEGLTAPARKRPIPRFPSAVGVVTSPGGAVLHDIVTVIRRRAPWTRIILCGCRVQGEGAAGEIAEALRRFGRAGCADVVIVGRGGGSVEDLWAFNEEVVARAIAESPVPVISAVGHETDVTIADLVADLRAPTPSAAAEAAVPDRAALSRQLGDHAARMAYATRSRLERRRSLLGIGGMALDTAATGVLRERRERLRSLGRHLNALSPLAAFARGYAVPRAHDGRVLRRTADFEEGAEFDLLVRDGAVPCRVAGVPREER